MFLRGLMDRPFRAPRGAIAAPSRRRRPAPASGAVPTDSRAILEWPGLPRPGTAPTPGRPGARDGLEDRADTAPLSGPLTRAGLALGCATHDLAGKPPRRPGARPGPIRHSAWCEARPASAATPRSAAEAATPSGAAGGHPDPEEDRP